MKQKRRRFPKVATGGNYEKPFKDDVIMSAFSERFEIVSAQWIEEYLEQMIGDAAHIAALCESPIESRLLAEMMFSSFGYNCSMAGHDSVHVGQKFEPKDGQSERGDVWIVPQADIAGCRVDFAVYQGDLNGDWLCVAIECDAHDFHERTKEQAAKDRARDRALLACAVPVIRFTGSEIWTKPAECVSQLGDVLTTLVAQRLHVLGIQKAPQRIADKLPAFKVEGDE